LEKTSSRTKCQEIESQKEKRKRTKLSCLRATPVNALRASLRNAFAIIVLFSSVVVAFYEQNMCRSLSDYVQNKPLSRSMETRRFSPRKKGGEIYLSKGELFRAKSESTARHVCFS
jgi:hypothetical protein